MHNLADNWFFWAVLSTFCMAFIAHFNHRRRLDPQLLNAWHATMAAVMLSAALPFMIWPEWEERRSFYIVAIASGLVMALGMVFFFRLSLRRTGRVTSLIIPLAAVGAYATWWLLMPSERLDFFQHPFKVTISIFSMLAVCFAIQKVRANDASWETFIFILPIGLAFGTRDAFIKWVVGSEMHVYATAMAFTLISVSVAALMAWLAAMPQPPGGRKTSFFDGTLLWGSFWCAFWTSGMLLSGIIALIHAPNPAYPGIVMALTPLWLYAYNYFCGETEEGSPLAGAFIILGAIGLLISTL